MTSESERSNWIEGVAQMEAVDRMAKTDASPEIAESKGEAHRSAPGNLCGTPEISLGNNREPRSS